MSNGKFILTMISIAVILILGVWFGLPFLMIKSPDVYAKAVEAVERLPDTAIPIIENTRAVAVDSIADTAEELESAATVAEESVSAAVQEQPESGAAVTDDKEEVLTEPIVEDKTEPKEPLNVDPLSALNGDPGYPWGIVVTNSYFYDASMQQLGILPGGTIVSCKGKQLIPTGYIFECHYMANRAWRNDTVIMYEADLVVFDTTYADANKEQRNLLVEYCRLYGRLEELRGEEQKKLLDTNPHHGEYVAAATAYKEFNSKVAVMKAEYEKSEGSKRLQLGEELRKLRYDQVLVKKRYDTASAEYKKWKEVNVNPRIATITTPAISEIERIMERLRPEVQKIVPGL